MPEVQESSFKILLVLGNALGHMQDLGFAHPNIQVEWLPKNITVFKSCTFNIILDANAAPLLMSLNAGSCTA
jgi:hypothetical protein